MPADSTIPIQIGTTVIQFPNTGQSAVWSEAVIQFAQLVAEALQSGGTPYDIPATVMTITANPSTDINITGTGSNLSFPSGVVSSFTFIYDVYLLSDSTSKTQAGVVVGQYNDDTSTWSLQHEFSGDVQTDGTPYATFTINSSDELLLSTASIAGVYDATDSRISYSAFVELVSNS